MANKAPAKSPRKATSPRKAAPRRAASPRAAGAASGDPAPAKGTGAAPAPDNALPQDNSGMVQSPYGAGVPTYTFFPQLDTQDPEKLAPIVFPKFQTVHAPRKWLWQVYDKGPLIQAFEWMKLAGIPRDLQERVVDLPDAEYERFWDGWFGEARTDQGE